MTYEKSNQLQKTGGSSLPSQVRPAVEAISLIRESPRDPYDAKVAARAEIALVSGKLNSKETRALDHLLLTRYGTADRL